MGFLDNVKSRFKNNDEEEFERAFHEGAWPEGVDDFEPMANTGSFLPTTYDIDPLADASLPGNAMHAAAASAEGAASPAGAPADEGYAATESVVRAAATSIYAAPTAPSPFQVIDGSLKPRGGEPASAPQGEAWGAAPEQVPGADPYAAAPQQPAPVADERPSGYSAGTPRYDMGDDNVQVFARPAGERAARPAATPHVEQKPFADRLRDRVAAANVSGQADETLGRSKAGMQAVPAAAARPTRRSEHTSDAELDAELEERRRSRRASSQARSERANRAEAELRERLHTGSFEAVAPAPERDARPERRDEPRAAAGSGPAPASGVPVAPRPVPMSCTVVRPRSYDDVRDIAQGVVAEHRPVVLMMRGCSNDLARRVLDFSFGLCCASGANMQEFGDHVYAVLPRGTALTDEDRASLRRQGVLR